MEELKKLAIKFEINRIQKSNIETCTRPTRNDRESKLFTIVEDFENLLDEEDARKILECRRRIRAANNEPYEEKSNFNQIGLLKKKAKL